MKLIFLFVFYFSFNAFSDQDYQAWQNSDGYKYVYVEGLQKDLFQTFSIHPSRGPKWGKSIENILRTTGRDFLHLSTYWATESYQFEACPHFTEEDFESADINGAYEVFFRWEAVKKINGPKKSVFYFAYYSIRLSNKGKVCKYTAEDAPSVFLNKTDSNGDLIYLGELSKTPQKK